nr:glycosyltransferase family 4 protein [Roseomonas acroporae]
MRLLFVGSHFARKGGCVAVRIAEMARERGLPIEVTVISKLEVGACSWTDPTNQDFYKPYFELLKAPNVVFHQGLPNAAVLQALQRSHFSLLPTFSDTFGFSAIEAMMNFAPVLGTRQGALPEFITDGENGLLLDLPLDHLDEWVHSSSRERGTAAFERMFRDEVTRLAEASLARLLPLWEDQPRLHAMRRAARETSTRLFDADAASRFWDDFYVEALRRPLQVSSAGSAASGWQAA